MSDSLKTDRNIDENLHMLKTESGEISSLSVSTEGNGAKVTGDLNVTGDVKTANQSTPLSDFDLATKKYVDDNAGGSNYYDTKITNYYASATSVFIPLAGYIAEMSGSSGAVITGQGEYVSFHAPYNGTLERLMFRSEVAQDGTLQVDLYESADNTETPATEIGTMDTVIDIADDTSTEVNFSSMTSGTNAIVKGRVYAVKITSPSSSLDTFVTTVWKWDITT